MSPSARGPTRRAAALAAVALALLAVAPAASAYPKPATYFLRDSAFPSGTPDTPLISGVPELPGDLVTLLPPGVPNVNTSDPGSLPSTVMDTDAPQTRLILPGQEQVLPVMFNSNSSANTGRIWGPILTLLFLPRSPTVQHANVTAQLVVVPKGTSPLAVPPAGEVIASNTFSMDAGNATEFLPNATSFVPPNPTDPQGAALYVAGQLELYGFTKLASSYKLAFLLNDTKSFIIDKTVPADSTVQLRLTLAKGSSPVLMPVAAGQPMAYWNQLTPGLVYVPWYAADPPRPTPTYTAPPPTTYTSTPYTNHGGDTSSSAPTKKKSPGVEVPLVVVGLAALVLLARRRLQQ